MNTTLPLNSGMPALGSAPADTSSATTYTDINGLEALKKDPGSPQAISGVAQQVEAMFLQMMLKSMRDAGSSNDPDSNEMSMYQDMFDKQVALTISRHQDLGIGAMLKRQLSGSKPATPAGAAAPKSALSPVDFINRVMPTIRRAASALGLNPLGLLAQAALETGWGQRMPRTADGSPSFNMFGIKAGDSWTGARATADTLEFSNGVATPRRTAFRAYGSIEDSVNDFASLLKNSPRYRDAVAAGSDPQAYIDRIGKSGYATDPDYANKLSQILNSDALRSAVTARTAAL
jgi:flagellar protein FlgJ